MRDVHTIVISIMQQSQTNLDMDAERIIRKPDANQHGLSHDIFSTDVP
jgi:hypothetical protein